MNKILETIRNMTSKAKEELPNDFLSRFLKESGRHPAIVGAPAIVGRKYSGCRNQKENLIENTDGCGVLN